MTSLETSQFLPGDSERPEVTKVRGRAGCETAISVIIPRSGPSLDDLVLENLTGYVPSYVCMSKVLFKASESRVTDEMRNDEVQTPDCNIIAKPAKASRINLPRPVSPSDAQTRPLLHVSV